MKRTPHNSVQLLIPFVFILQFGGLTECDVVIYLYAYGMAALETGNPQVSTLA